MTNSRYGKILRGLVGLLLICLGGILGLFGRGASHTQLPETPLPPSFPIEVDARDCPNPHLKHRFDLVAHDVLSDLLERFHGSPPENYPIQIRHGNHPHVDVPTDHIFRIQLGHTLTHPDYSRFVYELGHELGHVMIGVTSRKADGVMETIPTLASLQALDDLNQKWAVAPPSPDFQEYHPYLDSYRAMMEADSLQRLPKEVQAAVHDRRWYGVSLYLRYHILEMDADINSDASRDCQHLAAILLRANGISLADLLGYEARLDAPNQKKAIAQTSETIRMLHLMGRELPTDLLVGQLSAKTTVEGGFQFQEDGHWIWLNDCVHGDTARREQVMRTIHPVSLMTRTP